MAEASNATADVTAGWVCPAVLARMVTDDGGVSIQDRLDDAELLWRHGRREGALLNALVAVAALARREYPKAGDRAGFEALLRSSHTWQISVEFRGQQVDIDRIFYKWLRCHLVHEGALPLDMRIDGEFADPTTLSIRAGGEPEKVLLLTPGWFDFLTGLVRERLPIDAEARSLSKHLGTGTD